jgi:plasmid maintenance system killer protein
VSAAVVLHDSFLVAAYDLPKDVTRKLLKALTLFHRNPRHPSLNFENLHGRSDSLKSIRVDDNYRIILREGNVAPELLYVGPHDRAYRFADNFGGAAAQPPPDKFLWHAYAPKALRNLPPRQSEWSHVQGLLRTRKYLPIARFLLIQSGNNVELTFSQFESLLEVPLPRSAKVHRAWWANDFAGHVQASAWLAVGWKVSSVDLAGQRVAFQR